jgi:hypothetical protein
MLDPVEFHLYGMGGGHNSHGPLPCARRAKTTCAQNFGAATRTRLMSQCTKETVDGNLVFCLFWATDVLFLP